MGKLVKIKTQVSENSAEDFINSLSDEQKKKDSLVSLKLFEKITKQKPKLWGTSIVGYGEHRYESLATGRQVDWFVVGFAPRKGNISLYLTSNAAGYTSDLEKLGKHKTVWDVYISISWPTLRRRCSKNLLQRQPK